MNTESERSPAPDTVAHWSLLTTRLIIRRAQPCRPDVDLLLKLWSDPAVMRNVGFPSGLTTNCDEIARQLSEQPPGEFDCVLVVSLRAASEPTAEGPTGELIGECRLGSPDSAGIARTDIKLLPEHWGKGFGKEIKRALLDYLFTHTPCHEVRATPNKGNTRSIRLQESVGGRQVGEGVYQFPESLRAQTLDVPYVEYAVSREDWEKNRS